VQQLQEELCFLIGAITGSSRVSFVLVDHEAQIIKVLASSLGAPRTYDIKYDVPMLTPERPVVLLPSFRKFPSIANHPIHELVPNLHSVAAYLLHHTSASKSMVAAWNPAQTFFKNDQSIAVVERLITLCKMLIPEMNEQGNVMPNLMQSTLTQIGLREETNIFNTEPISKFLFDTLIPKQRLLARNGVSYLALRQWRKAIKSYQIKALEALKSDVTPHCVDQIADEMATAVTKVYGKLFTEIVPIPGGSSGRERSLSVLLAEALALRLKLPCNPVLKSGAVAKGSSHPKKSAILQPYKLSGDVSGNVLIVDDVATSGRHIELATMAIKAQANYVTAVTWIAD
jgi:hypothetical protein